MTREEAIERIRQNKAGAEFFAQLVGNSKSVDNALKDIEAFNMAIEALSDRPSGEWNRLSCDTFHCNLCGHTFILMQGDHAMNYCPNCGARMGGEEA